MQKAGIGQEKQLKKPLCAHFAWFLHKLIKDEKQTKNY